MTGPLDRSLLVDVFERSERRAFSGNVFQFTRDGIWLPIPLDVIDAALEAIVSLSLWDEGAPVRLMDAGMGDGRLVAGLCSLGSLGSLGAEVHALGIESHHSLYQLSLENLRRLPVTNWSVCFGSYLELETYERLGVAPSRIDVVLNYPDGNEEALVRFWREHGRAGANLLFLSPDQSLRFDGVTLETVRTIERAFRLYVCRV